MASEWMRLCQHLVPVILHQRDWQLIAEDKLFDFVEWVERAIVEGIVNSKPGASPKETVRRATIHAYCQELYQASGENGTLRQRRAFEEIGRHAQGVAFRYEQNPGVVQACVQRALQIVWEKREQMRSAGSFLRWIEQVVYYAIKGYWKEKHHRQEVPMSHLRVAGGEAEDDNEDLEHFWEALSFTSPPDDEIIGRELREQLWAGVRRVLAANPRYEAVIVGHYLYELSVPALSEMLRTPVRNVYVLKSRALVRLRTDEALLRQFADALETLPGGIP